MNSKVIIVGAGVVGGSVALALAEQGFHVTVIDKEKKVASGASNANGAQLSYSYTDTLASPATLKTLPKLLLGLDPAFRLTKNMDPDFMKWGIRFLRNCTSSRADKNTLAVLEIALRSCAVMNEWRDKYDFDFDHNVAQKLHVYENGDVLANLKPRIELKNRLGANQSIILKEKLLDLEPSLHHMNADLAGAVYSPDDEVGDAGKFTRASLDKAMELSGGQVLLGTDFQGFIVDGHLYRGIKTNNGEIEADYIVLCAGYQTNVITKKLALSVPITPMAGYVLSYPAAADTPEISVTDTANRMVVCRVGSSMRAAGMADMGQVAKNPPEKRIQTLETTLKHRFPLAGKYSHPSQPLAGVRPMTPDGRPIIQQFQSSNLFLNCGHGMLGWTLAAGSADLLRAKICKGFA
ncbi:MAG: FAD-dependent oxidoreductase [Thermodesulfobacteriota bacterium]